MNNKFLHIIYSVLAVEVYGLLYIGGNLPEKQHNKQKFLHILYSVLAVEVYGL